MLQFAESHREWQCLCYFEPELEVWHDGLSVETCQLSCGQLGVDHRLIDRLKFCSGPGA